MCKSLFPDINIADIAWIDINPSMVSAKVYLTKDGHKYMDEKTHQPAFEMQKRRIW